MKNLDTKNKSIVADMRGDDKAMAKAIAALQQNIAENIKADFEDFKREKDRKILAARGYRDLTSAENEFYNKFAESAKSADYKNSIANIDVSFPETVLEDVFKEITDTHPLLKKINFQAVTLVTKWILSDHTVTKATWGAINSAIITEIEGALKMIDLTQNKLTAFAIIPVDMLDMGAVFIDKYIRALLVEGLSIGLEDALINGTGKDCPIGLTRDIHEGVSVSDGVYPLKSAQALTSFAPEEYGAVLSTLATTEAGNPRAFNSVQLIVNPVDYFTKVMPATTVQGADGGYISNVFPFPTEVIPCTSVASGKAVLALLDEYFMGVGSAKTGVIEYSDEFKFLDDVRTYKTKFYGNGRAYDNTCAVYLDITDLEPAYITVKQLADVAATVEVGE